MAKKQKREVVRIKWMGLACFGIALALYALAIWGSNILMDPNLNIFGYTIEHFSNPDNIVVVFEDAITIRIISFFSIMFISILSLFASLKLIFMFFNILGFIGRKDAYKTAKKFSKFVKRAFAAIGLEITAILFFSFDDGTFTKDSITFFIVVGIAFAVLYIGTRAYRWFLVEKTPLLDALFIFIKDALYIGCLVFMASLMDKTLLTTTMSLETLFNLPDSSHMLANLPFVRLMEIVISFILFFVVTSLMRKTLRYFTLNNYKKSAYKKYLGGYITLFIFVLIFETLKEILYPLVVVQDFASIDVVSVVFIVLPKLIPYFAVILAVAFAGAVDGGYVKEIKLYVPCAKTNELAVEPANEEAVEETASEEVVEETAQDGTQEFEEPTEQPIAPIEEPANEPTPKKRGRKPKVSE